MLTLAFPPSARQVQARFGRSRLQTPKDQASDEELKIIAKGGQIVRVEPARGNGNGDRVEIVYEHKPSP
ncbi:MAG: hypothetical protein VKJ04_07940 [Vampirovibrionales bacterium]|nr:hypothetical protein [Vampirovibrionales bacterium]